jgi:poly-gamma-glutamate synthesis protein (capsule biosynthesis protein)
MPKTLVILGSVVILVTVGLAVGLSSKVSWVKVENKSTLSQIENPARLLFVGDIMLDRLVKKRIKTIGTGDYRFPFLKVHNYLTSFDAVISNLEGPIADTGKRVGSKYSFRFEPASVNGLKFANIKAVNLANNHIWDYSSTAFKETLKYLDQADIKYFGGGLNELEAYAPAILKVNNTTIGLLGFSQFLQNLEADDQKPGIATLNKHKFDRAIVDAKKLVDVLVVSFHWGDEYMSKSNEFQRKWARRAIDLGADLVVGHHPHVVQESEEYNGKFIFYSLGNFIFDQNFSEETMTAGLLEVEIKGRLLNVNFRKAKLNKNFQIELQ